MKFLCIETPKDEPKFEEGHTYTGSLISSDMINLIGPPGSNREGKMTTYGRNIRGCMVPESEEEQHEMIEIKPCPFCGGSADYWEDAQYSDRHVIECNHCGATKRSEYGYDTVLGLWNRRFDSKGQEVMEVSERRHRPRVLARLPNGGAVIVWIGEDTYDDLAEARAVGREAAALIELESQTIEA